MHVLGTGVPRRLGVARSAWSPKAAQALGCSPTPGLRISFGRVTCMARAATVPGLWTLGFLLLCGACVWVSVVLGFGFRLRPTTPRWGLGACVCLCACSACTPRHLAGVCGVGVCAWGRVSAAPGHSWLGCWGVCVCSCARSACTPPLLARVCSVGVCVSARVLAAPCHCWLGWWGVCVLVCVLPLYPATPRWGVRCGCVCLGWGLGCAPPLLAGVLGCACSGACSPCTPRLLAGVCGVGVRAWVRVSAAPRHSWLRCWGCVCSYARSACTPPLLAGVCGVDVGVLARVSAAARHSWLGC